MTASLLLITIPSALYFAFPGVKLAAGLSPALPAFGAFTFAWTLCFFFMAATTGPDKLASFIFDESDHLFHLRLSPGPN